MPTLSISPAVPQDAEIIHGFIHELAVYERLAHELIATPEAIRRSLFGRSPVAYSLVARLDDAPVGYALFFCNYSTFLGRAGVYLEDLYVKPEFRGRGIGKALLQHVARRAVAMGAGRLEWAVLDWNEPAIGFYKSLGASPLEDWTVFRLTGEPLAALGATDIEEPWIPVLQSARMQLRPGRPSDAQRITSLLQNPAIEANLGGLPWPYTVQDALAYLAGVGTKANEYDWLLDHQAHGVVGSIHLSMNPRHRSGYLGFWLGSEFWGQGLIAEAIQAVSAYGFDVLDLMRLEAEHFAHNPASGRAMEKAGFRLEGTRHGAFVKRGKPLDLVVYGITREVFEANR